MLFRDCAGQWFKVNNIQYFFLFFVFFYGADFTSEILKQENEIIHTVLSIALALFAPFENNKRKV